MGLAHQGPVHPGLPEGALCGQRHCRRCRRDAGSGPGRGRRHRAGTGGTARCVRSEEALAPDAPQVPLVSPTGQGNLCDEAYRPLWGAGSHSGASPVLYEETFHVGRQEHAYLEPEAALAIPHPDGSVTIHYNGQSPFINQTHMCRCWGCRPKRCGSSAPGWRLLWGQG